MFSRFVLHAEKWKTALYTVPHSSPSPPPYRLFHSQNRVLSHPKEYFLPDHPLPVPLHPPSPFSRFLSSPPICSVVGAPLADGQPLVGVDLGPSYIRQAGLIQRLTEDNWIVEDNGDIDYRALSKMGQSDPRCNHSDIVGRANQLLHHRVLPSARQNKFCLTLGGDHSIAIGSISAILKARPDTGILWVDAHSDIHTPSSSHSKNIHGMVVSFLMGLHESRTIKGFEWINEVPKLDPKRIVYVGLRDVDKPERNILKQLGVRAFSMQDVDRYGIAKVMEMSIEHVIGRVPRPLHLSFDIDSIDPAFAPSTGTRVMGGLSYREAYYICESAADTGCLSSMDLVEVNPSLAGPEGSNMTLGLAVGLISSAMGNRIL